MGKVKNIHLVDLVTYSNSKLINKEKNKGSNHFKIQILNLLIARSKPFVYMIWSFISPRYKIQNYK